MKNIIIDFDFFFMQLNTDMSELLQKTRSFPLFIETVYLTNKFVKMYWIQYMPFIEFSTFNMFWIFAGR